MMGDRLLSIKRESTFDNSQSIDSLQFSLFSKKTMTPTSSGQTISTLHEDEVKRKTTKFMMENKTIFEELAKL